MSTLDDSLPREAAGWPTILRARVGARPEAERARWAALLAHWATASQSRPGKRWLARAAELTETAGAATVADVIAAVLEAAAAEDFHPAPEKQAGFDPAEHMERYEALRARWQRDERQLRGAIWTAGGLGTERMTPALSALAARSFEKVRDWGPRSTVRGNACLIALADRGAVAALDRLELTHASAKKVLARERARAEKNRPRTPEVTQSRSNGRSSGDSGRGEILEERERSEKRPSTRPPDAPALGAIALEPGFSYLGDGGWVPPDDRLRCWVLFSDEVDRGDRERVLSRVPAPLSHDIRWDGPLLQIGSPAGQTWQKDRRIAGLVGRVYGPVDPARSKMSGMVRAALSGPDFDPKVLAAVERGYADYGDPAPWQRFYDALHWWLHATHAAHPIRLFVRQISHSDREESLSELHERSLDALFDGPLGDVARLVRESDGRMRRISGWVRDFVQELVLYASEARLDDGRLAALVPVLELAFGIDDYAEAAKKILFALPANALLSFVDGLPALAALVLVLRTDYLPRFLEMGAYPTLLGSQLSRFWSSSPDEESVAQLAFRLQYALFPARVDSDRVDAFDVIVEELSTRADRYRCPERFEPLVQSFERRGLAREAERLETVITAMRP